MVDKYEELKLPTIDGRTASVLRSEKVWDGGEHSYELTIGRFNQRIESRLGKILWKLAGGVVVSTGDVDVDVERVSEVIMAKKRAEQHAADR